MKKLIAAALIAAFSFTAVDSFATPWHHNRHHMEHRHYRHERHHRY